MSKMAMLCEKLSAEKLLQEFFNEAGFTFNSDLDGIVCQECGFKTQATLSILHIQFMHKLFNSKCKMVHNVYDEYNNFAYYNVLLHINDYVNVRQCVSNIKEMMTLTFQSWPKRLPRVEKLVSAGFYYTGVDDDVMCIECKVVLHDWEDTDNPWLEHEKASPDCILVKLNNAIILEFINNYTAIPCCTQQRRCGG